MSNVKPAGSRGPPIRIRKWQALEREQEIAPVVALNPSARRALFEEIIRPGIPVRATDLFSLLQGLPRVLDRRRSLLVQRMQDMIAYYEQRRGQVARGEFTLAQAIRNDDPDRLRWDRGLETRLQRNRAIQFFPETIRISMYRPFVKQHLCFDSQLVWSAYQLPSMFPTPEAPNQVMGVTGKGATTPFSSLITAFIPDHELVSKTQWLSRWRYEVHEPYSPDAWTQTDNIGLDAVSSGYRRVDNITDWCLQQFRTQYPALQITKDDIWSYLYGLLHAPDYRERYKADLSKDLPRIPLATDFGAFRDAGAALAQLHLGYETCPEYELLVEVSSVGPGAYHLSDKKMSWGGTRKEPDRSVLHVTPAVTLRDIRRRPTTTWSTGAHRWSGRWTGCISAMTRRAASSTIPTPGSRPIRRVWCRISSDWYIFLCRQPALWRLCRPPWRTEG